MERILSYTLKLLGQQLLIYGKKHTLKILAIPSNPVFWVRHPRKTFDIILIYQTFRFLRLLLRDYYKK